MSIGESQWLASLPQVGTAVETLEDCRAIGGTVRRVNVGVVERFTRTQIIVRNEHGNLQRFSRDTFESIPQLDRLSPSFFRPL
jgi:hypothetical protein